MECGGGSSVQAALGPRLFDFGSDDVLCSFEDYALRLETTDNGKLLDSSAKKQNLQGNRVRSPSANVYGKPEEFSREDVIYAIEKCMKKYSDNLTMHLEGISGRLAQVELHCYKLERSIGEFRTDMIRDQSEANLKLNSLEKHVHEVRRSVQIIRDKQALSEAQKQLTKLLLSQKDSTDSTHSQKKEKSLNSSVVLENKTNYESHDAPNQALALTLPYQISSSPPSIAITAPDNTLNQANPYYYTHHQPLLVAPQSQNLQPELHYAPAKQEPIVAANQPSHQQLFPQYQHHCSSQVQSPRLETQHNVPQERLSQAIQGSFAPPTLAKSGYVGTSAYPSSQSNMLGYDAVYVIDGNRTCHPQSYHLGSYAPNGNNGTALLTSCSYPYGNMSYPRDQMVGVVFGTAESG